MLRAWCRKTIGITPGRSDLYREAFRHVSSITDGRSGLNDNERLEFLGDSILDAIIGHLLFTQYADKDEGFLTRLRSKLVSRTQLNLLAKRMEIERVVKSNVAKGSESSVPGNALEALIGALFLDKGFDRTRKVVVGLLEQHFDLKEIEKEDRDGKSRLLEWGQKRRKRIDFVIHEETGPGRGRSYVCEVRINGEVKGTGRGISKKNAEQDAAQNAFHGMRSRKPRPARQENGLQENAPAPSPRPTERTASKKPGSRSANSIEKPSAPKRRRWKKPGNAPGSTSPDRSL